MRSTLAIHLHCPPDSVDNDNGSLLRRTGEINIISTNVMLKKGILLKPKETLF